MVSMSQMLRLRMLQVDRRVEQALMSWGVTTCKRLIDGTQTCELVLLLLHLSV